MSFFSKILGSPDQQEQGTGQNQGSHKQPKKSSSGFPGAGGYGAQNHDDLRGYRPAHFDPGYGPSSYAPVPGAYPSSAPPPYNMNSQPPQQGYSQSTPPIGDSKSNGPSQGYYGSPAPPPNYTQAPPPGSYGEYGPPQPPQQGYGQGPFQVDGGVYGQGQGSLLPEGQFGQSLPQGSSYHQQQQQHQQQQPHQQQPHNQSPPEMPPLPQGWIAQWDQNAQRHFFVNTNTRVSQWEHPNLAPGL